MVRWCVSDENSWHKIEKYASTFVSPQKQHLTWEMNSVDCHDITTQEQLRNKQVAQIIKRYIAESTSKNQTSKIGKQEHRKRVCQKCRWWGEREKQAYRICHWWWSRGIPPPPCHCISFSEEKPFQGNSYCGSYMCRKKERD
jgi:hypothetical protein